MQFYSHNSALIRRDGSQARGLGLQGDAAPSHTVETQNLVSLPCLETTMQNVERRVLVPIHHQPAMWAGMGALTQLFWHKRTAVGAHFGGVG